jgi:hypothetical protein
MTISRTWSDEAVIDGESGEYWKRTPSIISKQNSLKDVVTFSRRINYISSMWSTLPPKYPGNWGLQMPEVERHLEKHRSVIKKVKLFIFQAWKKRSQHISITDNVKVKEYPVDGKMKKYSVKKKDRKYAYGGDEDCHITSVVTAAHRRKLSRKNTVNLT